MLTWESAITSNESIGLYTSSFATILTPLILSPTTTNSLISSNSPKVAVTTTYSEAGNVIGNVVDSTSG